ncbi:MAG TPA: hypothetical protein VH420_05305 [Gaiellaceae bacterium]|jgi:hypothetical protein
MRFVKALAVIVPLLVASLGLVFTVRPSLKPCVGASDAEFTGTPVFPHVHFRDHLFRTGASRAEIRGEPDTIGAEVRFSYKVDDLRGAKLPIRWTLVSVEKDGTLGAVDRSQDRSLARVVTPDACSETGGQDLFVQIPDRRKRYRVVLEMYRGRDLEDRLALAQTPIFSG